MKDQLYLMRLRLENAGWGLFKRSDLTRIEVVLSFLPELQKLIDVHYVEFPRLPQPPGNARYQWLATLMVAEGRELKDKELEPYRLGRHRMFTDENNIRRYLSSQYAQDLTRG